MKDTQSAITTLQAFVKTQQPLIDTVNYAINLLQGNYDEAIKQGDLKIAIDQKTEIQSQLDDANNQLDDIKSKLSPDKTEVTIQTDSSFTP